MEKAMITCPACGASVPYARRCRKCAAPLDESLAIPQPEEQVSPRNVDDETRFEITLIGPDALDEITDRTGSTGISPVQQTPASGQYFLKVVDRSGYTREKRIAVEGKSGMRLARWKVTRSEPHPILSAYFYINSEGQDLNLWIHYDLVTGQKLGMNQGDEQDPDPAANLSGKKMR